MRVRNSIFLCVFLAICISIGILLGPIIPFEIQKTLSSTLSGIASILFGVLGIWIGIMAPDNLKSIYTNCPNDEKRKNWKDLEQLYKPVFISLIVFAVSTSFSFLGELLKAITALKNHYRVFRITGLSILMLLMFTTFYLVIISIKPGISMLAKSITFIAVSEKMDSRFPEKKVWKNE